MESDFAPPTDDESAAQQAPKVGKGKGKAAPTEPVQAAVTDLQPRKKVTLLLPSPPGPVVEKGKSADVEMDTGEKEKEGEKAGEKGMEGEKEKQKVGEEETAPDGGDVAAGAIGEKDGPVSPEGADDEDGRLEDEPVEDEVAGMGADDDAEMEDAETEATTTTTKGKGKGKQAEGPKKRIPAKSRPDAPPAPPGEGDAPAPKKKNGRQPSSAPVRTTRSKDTGAPSAETIAEPAPGGRKRKLQPVPKDDKAPAPKKRKNS